MNPSLTRFSVVPTGETHLPELYAVLDTVAREGKYLAFTEAPPRDASFAFYRGLLEADSPFFVALEENRVVGWCDVSPLMGQSRAHIGVLGIGLLQHARHHGLGTQLMQAAIAKSWSNGLTRIQLDVRDDNLPAHALYKRLGFEEEGVKRRGSVVGSDVHDLFTMALLR
jgi:ribosomal protein S18 acetylase RimI-like enzyme